MRKIATILVVFLIASVSWGQDLNRVDFISPFHDDLAAVNKGDSWGFIDKSGTLVVDYRNDLVVAKRDKTGYPIFNSGRCLIKTKKKGITYFGYIDKTGATVIEPRFLNATDFNDGWAVALEFVKRRVGTNELLEKPLVSYDYFEAMIDPQGKVVHYLVEEPVHIALDREYLRQPPKITCKVLSDKLIAQYNSDKTWTIRKIE